MGKPGPKAINIFQKLKLGNNSVKSMPKYSTSPVKKALKGNQDELPMELQAAIKAAPGKKYKSHAKQQKLVTAKEKAGGSFDKPVGTKAGAEKRKAIIAKVKKEGEAKVSASYSSPARMSPLMGALAMGAAAGGASKIVEKVVGPSKKLKTPAKKYKSHSKKKKSMAYKFKSDAQRKAAYASGYKGK